MTEPAVSRTRNAAATRAAILSAAQDRFARDAYEQVGIREIGAQAGVDPALVCRYFGSKEELFAQVLASAASDPMEIIDGDRSTFGRRLAEAILRGHPPDERKMAFLHLAVRSAASPIAQKLVRRDLEERFIRPFAAWLGGAEAEERARLAASVLMGVAVFRGVLFAPSGGEDRTEAAIARLAAVLQGIIDEPAA